MIEIILGCLFVCAIYYWIRAAKETKKLKHLVLSKTRYKGNISFAKSYKMTHVPCVEVTSIHGVDVKNCVMLIDTGANANFIREDIISKCFPEYKKDLEYDSDIMTIQGTMEMNKSLITSIKFEGSNMTSINERFIVIDNNTTLDYIAKDTGKTVAGIIGSEFMNHCGFQIDMENLEITY